MNVEGSQSFARVIEDHLELKRRNAGLDGDMPLDRYRSDDKFDNHPLFKSEEQARLEETLSGSPPMVMDEDLVLAWPVAETADEPGEGGAEGTPWGPPP